MQDKKKNNHQKSGTVRFTVFLLLAVETWINIRAVWYYTEPNHCPQLLLTSRSSIFADLQNFVFYSWPCDGHVPAFGAPLQLSCSCGHWCCGSWLWLPCVCGRSQTHHSSRCDLSPQTTLWLWIWEWALCPCVPYGHSRLQ